MLVSIITPTFNRVHTILRAIKSVRNQSHKRWEIIIIDDFSTDSTEEEIKLIQKEDSRVKYFKNEIKGANNARNLGLKNAVGDFVVFLDSDDELYPNMLEINLLKFQEFSSADISVCFTHAYHRNHLQVKNTQIDSENLLFEFLIKKVKWPINSVMIKRETLLRYDIWFHPKLMNAQDFVFFSSLLKFNPKVVYVKEFLSINHHDIIEENGVKVSSGRSKKYLSSKLKSRNLIFKIAVNSLPFKEFVLFLGYYLKFQSLILLELIKVK